MVGARFEQWTNCAFLEKREKILAESLEGSRRLLKSSNGTTTGKKHSKTLQKLPMSDLDVVEYTCQECGTIKYREDSDRKPRCCGETMVATDETAMTEAEYDSARVF